MRPYTKDLVTGIPLVIVGTDDIAAIFKKDTRQAGHEPGRSSMRLTVVLRATIASIQRASDLTGSLR
jgi:hypothetical protein